MIQAGVLELLNMSRRQVLRDVHGELPMNEAPCVHEFKELARLNSEVGNVQSFEGSPENRELWSTTVELVDLKVTLPLSV